MKIKKTAIAKFVLSSVFLCLPLMASAQWAVVDAGNIAQTTITAMENIAQTTKQLEQYRKQLQQLEDQIRNSTAPAQYLWDEANITIKRIVRTTNTLNQLKAQAGSIDRYLQNNYGTVENYRAQKCYTSQKCTTEEWQAVHSRASASSTAQAQATEAMLRGLDEQQDSLQVDADNLARIQGKAQNAEGRLEAMGYANQLASSQVNQLLQMRSLLVAQQTAAGIRQRALEDQEAQQRATGRQLREGKFEKSESKVW